MPGKLLTARAYADKRLAGRQISYNAVDVTLDDSNDLPDGVCDAIEVLGNGNVKVSLSNVNKEGGGSDGTAVLTSVVANQIVRIAATRIWATGTTSSAVRALYRS